jgi:hypothetical protein
MANPNVQRGFIGEFHPETDEFDIYQERFEHYLEANQIADAALRRSTFLATIGNETYSLLRSLCSPDRPGQKTLEELFALLAQHYQPRRIQVVERDRFHQRKQKEHESCAQFIAALRKMSEHCGYTPQELQVALKDRFIAGLRKDSIKKQLFTVENLTLDRAVELAVGFDAAEQSVKPQVAAPMNVNRLQSTKPRKQQQGPRRSKPPAQSSGRQCFRCGKKNHLANKCFHINDTCTFCNKVGHLECVCLTKKRLNKGNSQVHYEQVLEPGDAQLNMVAVLDNTAKIPPPLLVDVEIESDKVTMEVDTGADLSMISASLARKVLPHVW